MGFYLAVENVCDACAFAAGEPCHDKGVGGLDERGDGERAAGIVGVAAGYKNFAVGIQRKNLVVLEDDETFLNGFAGDLAVFFAADVLGDAYIGGGAVGVVDSAGADFGAQYSAAGVLDAVFANVPFGKIHRRRCP